MGRYVYGYELSEEGRKKYNELRAFIIENMKHPFYTTNLKVAALNHGYSEDDFGLLMKAFDDLGEEGIVKTIDLPPEMRGPTTYNWAFIVE